MTGRKGNIGLLIFCWFAVACSDLNTKSSSTGNPVPSGPVAPTLAAPQPVASSDNPKRCVVYEAAPDFGTEWVVKKYRAFECYAGYDLWVRQGSEGEPFNQREKPDVVVKLCERDMSGYDPLDRTDRKSRGKRVKVLLPNAFINAEIEKNKRLEFSGQLEVERKYDEGVSGVLVATFKDLTLTQLGSLLEALTQAPGEPWPDQAKFRYGSRCAVFTAPGRDRWELLRLLAP